ncbi:hypothetical protein ACROYT_G008492 [Oculina patagonica]
MSGFTSFLMIFIFLPYIQSLYSNEVFRSSYLTLWDDHVLLGHVISLHPARGVTSCAQGCLSNPRCLSFNFGKKSNVCELNNSSSQFLKHLKDFVGRPGFVHGHWITVGAVMQFVFTTLGAQGPMGPTNTSGYLGTLLEGKVQLSNGIQEWTVPYTGTYFIEAFGASGANGTCDTCSGWKRGGLGAKIAGSFKLQHGQTLKILVGQKGRVNFDFPQKPGGGGGGTFVTLMNNWPLIIAGGGGGASISTDGDPGQASQEGTRHGGKAGSGGRRSDPNIVMSGTGAGLWGDGEGLRGISLSFQNGGFGVDLFSRGGFGGGGYGMVLPGGGGGYSGGGVDNTDIDKGTAGGGGSINNGASQINEGGVNEGDGRLIITLMN